MKTELAEGIGAICLLAILGITAGWTVATPFWVYKHTGNNYLTMSATIVAICVLIYLIKTFNDLVSDK